MFISLVLRSLIASKNPVETSLTSYVFPPTSKVVTAALFAALDRRIWTNVFLGSFKSLVSLSIDFCANILRTSFLWLCLVALKHDSASKTTLLLAGKRLSKFLSILYSFLSLLADLSRGVGLLNVLCFLFGISGTTVFDA